jgi:AP-2 complex subunit alpha
MRKSADDSIFVAEEWGLRMASLLDENDLGVLLGLTSLLIGIVSKSYKGYEPCVPRLVEVLDRLRERDVPQDYTYYGIPTPWLQVKILRALQYFPAPDNPDVLGNLKKAVKEILSANDPVKNANKSNAVHAIVFEAASTAVSIRDAELAHLAVNLIIRLLKVRESNLKYLALENLGRLSQSPHVSEAIAKHQEVIMGCLTDPDSSIAGGALNLLFTTANKDTAPSIVDNLLSKMEEMEEHLREDLVLKAAILAERFPASPAWYVDAMLRLILCAGESTSNEMWHSILHLVSSREELHEDAVNKVIANLKGGIVNEAFLQCAAYILGEYGTNDDREEFDLLYNYFDASLPQAKAMMLNCFEKMRTRAGPNSNLTKAIDDIMDKGRSNIDPEIQQRALEYFSLSSLPDLANVAMAPLPQWEVNDSVLLRKLVISNELEDQDSRDVPPLWLLKSENDEDRGEEDDRNVAYRKDDVVLDLDTKDEQEEKPQGIVADLLSFNGEVDDQNNELEETLDSALTNDVLAEDSVEQQLGSLMEGELNTAIENPLFTEKHHTSTDPIGSIDEWRKKLFGRDNGIFYEDGNVQIGAKMRCNGSAVELDFFVGNKTTEDIQLTRFDALRSESLKFGVSFSEHPSVILPGQQILVKSTWTCLLPNITLPEVQLQYVAGSESAAKLLALPLSANKFCTPASISADVFLKRWNQVLGPPFKVGRCLECTIKDKAAVVALLEDANFQPIIVPALGNSVNAAALFHSVEGKIKQVPCMVSVSMEQTGLTSLDVVTADADVSSSILFALLGLLEVHAQNLS